MPVRQLQATESGDHGKENPTEIFGPSLDWKRMETLEQQWNLSECGENLRHYEENEEGISQKAPIQNTNQTDIQLSMKQEDNYSVD